MDVQRLCNAYIPAWLATGGMGADKISQFYDDPVKRASYLLPSPLIELSTPVREFASGLLDPRMPVGEAIGTVYHAIYEGFSYTQGATTVATTLPEVINARAGVCQDFAHLAVASFRAVGLPARYVSGYIETYPPPGEEKLAGSDATHAWASVYIPERGWIDLDPTNDQLGEQDNALGQTALGHDLAGENEEGNGHQRVIVDPVDHGLRDDHEVPESRVNHQTDRRQYHHQGNRDAHEEKNKQAAKEDNQFHD